MTKFRGALRAFLLAAALSTTTTAAMSVRANALFARDDTCGDKTYTKCPQAGFPDDFCCTPGTSCISLAGNTTILCCPDGSDCAVIAPIVCSVQLQDAGTNPQAVVKTTALTSELPTCGSNCCPFGYTCDEDQNCAKNEDQSKKPEGAADASSTASTPASTPTRAGQASTAAPTASTTSSSDADVTATAAPEAGTQGPGDVAEGHTEAANTSAIIGGVVGGFLFLVGIVIAILYWRFLARRAKKVKQETDQEHRKSTVSNAPSMVSRDARRIEKDNISFPLPQQGFTYGRTDFVAKSHPSPHSTPTQAQEGFGSAKSYRTRDSYQSWDSAADPRFEERSFHASAIVHGLKTDVRADAAARREEERLEQKRLDAERLREYEAQFETLDIGLSPDLALGRNNQRDTALTQWPAHPRPGGHR